MIVDSINQMPEESPGADGVPAGLADQLFLAEQELEVLRAEREQHATEERAREHAAQVAQWTSQAAKRSGLLAEHEHLVRGATLEEAQEHAALLAKVLPRRGHVPTEGNPVVDGGSTTVTNFVAELFGGEV